MSVAPIMLAARGGEHLFYDGGLLTFKATGSQTDGALLLFEVSMPRGKATPLHIHPDADETFYVFEGEVRVHIEGMEDRTVSDGSVVVIPRGTPHAFAVTSSSMRMLVIMTPASTISETFFRLAGEPAPDPTMPSPPTNPERFGTAVAQSGLQVVGPPPFAAPTTADSH
ncbi:MAG TPA: quercetin 2,3-dioxygenase [Ktedonobacterales bacterium]|nr:quercetin 2,3-dioxygenase [Ktedonobacterales bacterium]